MAEAAIAFSPASVPRFMVSEQAQGILHFASGPSLPALVLFLTLSQRAHTIVCDSSIKGVTFYRPDGGSERVSPRERQDVRQALEDTLSRDWPPYIQSMIDQGRIRAS